jgi:glycine betaine/proline transport system permease protein
MLGVNQGIIMVLSVVVIGGLVGSGALGDQVARGLQRNEFGQGVVASIAILALGIALDRVTQGKRPAREVTSRGPLFGGFARRRRQVQLGGGAV